MIQLQGFFFYFKTNNTVKYFFYFLFLIGSLYSCSPTETPSEKTTIEPIDHFTLDSTLHLDDRFKSIQLIDSPEQTPILHLMDNAQTYCRINLNNGKTDTSFNTQKLLGKLKAFTAITNDSVVFFTQDNRGILWSNNNILKPFFEFNISDFIAYTKGKQIQITPFVESSPTILDPIRVINHHLYIPNQLGPPPNGENALRLNDNTLSDELKRQEKIRTDREYNRATNDLANYINDQIAYFDVLLVNDSVQQIVNDFGNIPESYFGMGQETYLPLGYWKSSTLGPNNSFVVAYFKAHEITVYNTEGTKQKEVHVPSRYIKSFSTLKLAEFQEKFQERIVTEPIYGGIYFDPYRNLYYRVAVHRQPFYKDEARGLKNTEKDRNWSLMVMNADFELLEEYSFPPNTYMWTSMFVGSKGLYIKRLKATDNCTVFDIFDLSPETHAQH